MKLIWAFKFSKSKDPETKQDKVYDLNDYVKVSLFTIFHAQVCRPGDRVGYPDRSEPV